MLAHPLPVLPELEQFWDELPNLFAWLNGDPAPRVLKVVPINVEVDSEWRAPTMVSRWRTTIPMESVRFAAANHLCVNLRYKDSWRLIEPYSLRRSAEGNLLLCAIKHGSDESRSYRVDRIQAIDVSTLKFIPRYRVELTPVAPLALNA